MSTILKRKSRDADGNPAAHYQVKIRLRGFPAATATFSRMTDARRWAAETEAAIRDRRYFSTHEAAKHTLADLIDRYIADVLPAKRSSRDQERMMQWWKDQLGHLRLSEVTPPILVEARDRLARGTTRFGTPRSASTVMYYLRTLSHALSMASREWGLMDDNPLRRVTKPRLKPGRVRYLSDEERNRLLDAAKSSDNTALYAIIVLALSTGMRKSEVLGLTWDRVDLRRRWITLEHTKNNERRGLALRGTALNALAELSKTRRIGTPLVFPGETGKPIYIGRAWGTALKRAGIQNFRFHDLRHSAASYLAMNGATPGEIAAVLGHKTLQMVKRYAHLSDAHVASVIERMNERIFNG